MPETVPVTLPAMGESVTEGTIVEWRRQPGEAVSEGDVLADVTTDKVDVEVPAPVSGVLVRVLVEAGATAAVGAVLAEIAVGATATATDGAAPAPAASPAEPAPAPAPAAEGAKAASAPPPRRKAAAGNGAGIAAAPAAGGERVEVTLPSMGESVTEGTVGRWLKQVGDPITRDEPLVEVTTDKVDVEVPAPASGVLLEIRVADGESIAVGAVLGVVAAGAGEATPATAAQPAPAAPAPAAPAPVAPAPPAPSPAAPAPAAPPPTDLEPVNPEVVEPAAEPVAPTSPHRPDLASSPLGRRAAALRRADLA